MSKHIVVVLLSLFIGACTSTASLIMEGQSTLKTPQLVIKKSKDLVNQQHWEEAQGLLKNGIVHFPKSKRLKEQLKLVERQWETRKRRLEDWILVYYSSTHYW